MSKSAVSSSRLARIGPQRPAASWLSALRGRTVLVVHPFNETIAAQLRRGALFWEEGAAAGRTTATRWKLVRPPLNFAGRREHERWQEALEALIAAVDGAGSFHVAPLSCGGLGMPLGAYLRATGRSAVYVGGALQLLFGIRGGRWDYMSAFMDGHGFVCPSEAETPRGAGWNYSASGADDGAYWCP